MEHNLRHLRLGYRPDDRRIVVRFRQEQVIFYLEHVNRLWGPPILLFSGYREVVSPRIKRLVREANHSPPSIAEVKNAWSCNLILQYARRHPCFYLTLLIYVFNKTGNVRLNVTLRRVRATIAAMEKQ